MHLGRQMAEQKADPVMNGLGLDRMVVIQDQGTSASTAVSSLSKVIKTDSMGGGWGDCSNESDRSPRWG
jgi:hypothetical protein